jgi:pSer/pThr/pTyr-binding forkhead associated (FHA) protein
MGDPRLNSIHLEFPRRDNFRRCRDMLLESRGNETVLAEEKAGTALDRTPADQPPPDSVARFWLTDGDYVYPLHIGLNTVGRSPDNDVVVHDNYVSRRHCTILVHADRGVELHDTASKNGTFINGLKMSGPTRLKPGDELRMCNRQFILLSHDTPARPPQGNTHTLAD